MPIIKSNVYLAALFTTYLCTSLKMGKSCLVLKLFVLQTEKWITRKPQIETDSLERVTRLDVLFWMFLMNVLKSGWTGSKRYLIGSKTLRHLLNLEFWSSTKCWSILFPTFFFVFCLILILTNLEASIGGNFVSQLDDDSWTSQWQKCDVRLTGAGFAWICQIAQGIQVL